MIYVVPPDVFFGDVQPLGNTLREPTQAIWYRCLVAPALAKPSGISVAQELLLPANEVIR
jgi:hypothetical protein